MTFSRTAGALVALVLGTQAAYAAGPTLIATGSIPGSGSDLSVQTSKPLENGVPGNLLGGIGSGLAHAGSDRFVAVPDRGPNAVSYDPCVDDTVSYITRFDDLRLRLGPNAGAGLPFVLRPSLEATTLLWSGTPLDYGTGLLCPVPPPGGAPLLPDGTPKLNNPHTSYFTGRSDGFGTSSSLDPDDARFDPESVRIARDRKSLFVSDEYGPYIYQFDRESGRRIGVFTLPPKFGVSHVSPQGDDEISSNTSGRVSNKGMEGLAITPDGSMLVGIMQSALIQDGGDKKGQVVRLVTIDIASGAVMHEYAYPTYTGSKTTVSDIVALNDHVFIVDERDGAGLGDGTAAVFKKLYLVDIDGATDVSTLTGKSNLAANALKKYLLMDVVSAVTGGLGVPATQVPAKLEGVALGEDVVIDGAAQHTLYLANDNDFDPDPGNPNRFFVFAFSDTDVANAPGSDDPTHTFGGDGHDATFVPQVFEKP